MNKPVRIIVIAFVIFLALSVALALYFIVISYTKGNAITTEELLGTWTADYRDPPDTIVLRKDFKYVHTYVLPNGKKVVDTDTWELESPSRDPRINFHHFALFRPDRQSYSCNDNWSVAVEPWLNKRHIVVDSDENFYFEK